MSFTFAGSSNGRTVAFEAINFGSTPSPAANKSSILSVLKNGLLCSGRSETEVTRKQVRSAVAIPVGSCHKFSLPLAVAGTKRRLQGSRV